MKAAEEVVEVAIIHQATKSRNTATENSTENATDGAIGEADDEDEDEPHLLVTESATDTFANEHAT